MEAVGDAVESRICSAIFFNQPGLDFLRDARVAGQFAGILVATEVCWVKDRFPDFRIKWDDGKVEEFEVIEADDPDRRRDNEYRRRALCRIKDDPEECWCARAEAVPGWIRGVCQKKVDKKYDPRSKAALLIHLNMGEYGVYQKEVETSFAEATCCAKTKFSSVWVLWKSKTYHVWENGRKIELEYPRS